MRKCYNGCGKEIHILRWFCSPQCEEDSCRKNNARYSVSVNDESKILIDMKKLKEEK